MPPQKIYTPRLITAITFLGGPIAGAIAVSKNWQAIGDEDKKNQAIRVGIGFTLAMLAILFILPEAWIDALPSFLLPVIYTMLTRQYVNQYQKEQLDQIIADGGEKHRLLNGLGLAAFGILATGVIMLIILVPFVLLA